VARGAGPAAPEIVGRSAALESLREELAQLAPTEVTVLIEGETGTGKELVAEWIHRASPRARQPFVVFDCGAVAPALIESELFGHTRGAFTGATSTRAGFLEEASGGTLFLDELGELPRSLQPKLLRLLERREIRRVGSSRPLPFDVRVIAATNRDLAAEVRSGSFREDLYFRIAGARVVVPPLRDRLDDLEPLVDRFLEVDHSGHRRPDLPRELWDRLRAHRWPGNVRELRNVVQRLVLSPGRPLQVLDSDLWTPRPESPPAPVVGQIGPVPLRLARRDAMAEFERHYLESLREAAGGNISRAATLSGVSRQMLHRLIRKHGVHWSRSAGES
jgi:transcriptional regulator with GAF, ATPase, and Fis domain